MTEERKFIDDLIATGNYRVLISPKSVHDFFKGLEDEDILIATIEFCEEEMLIRAEDAIKFLSFIPRNITVVLYYLEDAEPAVKATRLNGEAVEIKGLALQCKGEGEEFIKHQVFQTMSGMFEASPCIVVPVEAYEEMERYYRLDKDEAVTC